MDELKAMLDTANLWPVLVLAVLVYSFIPHLVLHLAVLLYPAGNERRAQLVADLHDVPRWKKPFWVVEMVLMAAFEAIPLRMRRRRTEETKPKVEAYPEHRERQSGSGDGSFRYPGLEAFSEDLLLVEALAALSPQQQHVMMLRVGKGISADEVAGLFGTQPSVIREIQHSAIQDLRTLLQPPDVR